MRTVAVVTNIPRPYRRALFRTLGTKLAAEDIRLRILYTSNPAKHIRRGSPGAEISDPDMETYVPGATFRTGYERVLALPTGLSRVLAHEAPSCVVVGGFGADAVMTSRWCRSAKVPNVLWSGAWPGRERNVGRLRSRARKRLVNNAQAFVAYGTAAAEYLKTLGARCDRVFYGWNTVDLETIASAARAAAERRAELVPKYGLATRNLLFVGTLVETKGVRELVSAALASHSQGPDWALHFVGAGPLREELESTVRAAGNAACFRFQGLRPAEDVAELLGVADGFFLPTKLDAWGLVINEAMACGVPVVVSPWAGATRDLIEDGASGYIIDPSDTAALVRMISRLCAGDPACAEVGRKGAEAVRAKASLERSAEGFASAIRCAMSGNHDD